ncbi:hypothetical protein ANCCAN_23627 [Ancylostoma caninum]|uniref:Uncharacterized protein n=1 Tax=Ancylostoma caninum TaxID=29170 RepID=A0A368FEI4_ANCCA|nr:hypothetical protein ANCCAN_23627 [Ancylostoma caninum]
MPPHDVVVKIEEPDYFEENGAVKLEPVPDDEIDAAVGEIDENLRVYGVKIWPHVCNTVKLKRSSAEKRELYRKCTGLVLRRDPDVYDRSLSRLLAKRYTEYGLWAGTLTRYALVIRNKLRPNNNGRTIPLTVIDDDDENEGTSQSWPEVDIGGVFPHVDLSRKRSDFDRLFDGFVQQTHEAFLINKPTLEPNVLREMVLEAFKGKKTIRSVAKRRIEVVQLWRICNAMATLFHAYNNQGNFEKDDCVRSLMNFCLKYGFIAQE